MGCEAACPGRVLVVMVACDVRTLCVLARACALCCGNPRALTFTRTVKVWDTRAGVLVGTLEGTPAGNDHTDTVFALATLTRGRLCSGGSDSKVIVWDVSTPSAPTKDLEFAAHLGAVYALGPMVDNPSWLLSAGQDGLVKVGVCACACVCAGACTCVCMRVVCMSVCACVLRVSGFVVMGNAATIAGRYHCALALARAPKPPSPRDCVCLHCAGSLCQVWDITMTPALRLVATLGAGANNLDPALGHTDAVISVVSPKLGVVVSGGRDDRALVWQRVGLSTPATYTVAHVLSDVGSGDVTSLAVLPSARQDVPNAIVAVGCVDGRVRLFDLATGVLKHTIVAHAGSPIHSLAMLRDSVLVTGSADGTFALWETYLYSLYWTPVRVRGRASVKRSEGVLRVGRAAIHRTHATSTVRKKFEFE